MPLNRAIDESMQQASGPVSSAADALPLWRKHPLLEANLPHMSLGQFPTLVERLDEVGDAIGLDRLYLKRDDLTGVVYGGNKVRKLEFLLGAALRDNARQVITMGFAGSNHALATAIYARQLGLTATSLLLPQANAHYVRRNLLAGRHHQAELRHYANFASLSLGLARRFLQGKRRHGVFPTFIPAGGSCPLGVVGYVNAALELNDQIAAGHMPKPDRIYVPLGSMGTSVGLAIGLQAAGLSCPVVAVRVIEARLASARKMAALFRKTVRFLRKTDPTFPHVTFSRQDLTIRNDCLGQGYARFTPEGVRAAALMREHAGIVMNGAYSAKAFSAVVDDARKGELDGKVVLFWNTYNSRDLSAVVAREDYRQLPRAFHRYFEEDVQPLDRDGVDR